MGAAGSFHTAGMWSLEAAEGHCWLAVHTQRVIHDTAPHEVHSKVE